jgi:hypothetical protein
VPIPDYLDEWKKVLLVRVVHARGKQCVFLKHDGSMQVATKKDEQSPTTSPTGTPVKAAAAASPPSGKRTRAAAEAKSDDDEGEEQAPPKKRQKKSKKKRTQEKSKVVKDAEGSG